MSKLIFGSFYDIGGRKIYEDRVVIHQFTTPGRLNLTVAMIADGVGGQNRGERAAQVAVDVALNHMTKVSVARNVPQLLQEAVTAANQVVLGEGTRTNGATTTLAIAAIQDEKRLYVANVGDSRIYLCRQGKLTQLTIDHTFATVMPWLGKMSATAAAANPRSDVLVYFLGRQRQIPVDVGFYVGDADRIAAHQRGCQGLQLKKGDAILVCSDGLVSELTPGRPIVSDREIAQVLTTQEGNKAARTLVSFALGRNADDNVSVAVLQMPDPSRKRRARQPVLRAILLTLILSTIALSLMGSYLQRTAQGQVGNVWSTATAASTQTAAAMASRQAAQADAATADAVVREATVEAALEATATQQRAAELTRAYQEHCLLAESFTFTVGAAILSPTAPIVYDGENRLRSDLMATVSWPITNNADCPLRVAGLVSLDNSALLTPTLESERPQEIAPKETSLLVATFKVQNVAELQELKAMYEAQTAWKLQVEQNGSSTMVLVTQPSLVLHDPAIGSWITIRYPTITPPAVTATLPVGSPTPLPLSQDTETSPSP